MISVQQNIQHQLDNVARGLWAECAGASVDMAGFVRVEVVSVEEQLDGSFLVRIVERVEDKPIVYEVHKSRAKKDTGL